MGSEWKQYEPDPIWLSTLILESIFSESKKSFGKRNVDTLRFHGYNRFHLVVKGSISMKSPRAEEMEELARQALGRCLAEVPFARLGPAKTPPIADSGVDLLAHL